MEPHKADDEQSPLDSSHQSTSQSNTIKTSDNTDDKNTDLTTKLPPQSSPQPHAFQCVNAKPDRTNKISFETDGRFVVSRMDTSDDLGHDVHSNEFEETRIRLNALKPNKKVRIKEEKDTGKKDSVNDEEFRPSSDEDPDSPYEEEDGDDEYHHPSIWHGFTYAGGVIPAPDESKKNRKLGTILGVYFPCIQNILGVIVFIRLPWIIGIAGIMQSLAIVVLCCLATLLTAISMSAIATNGRVPAGGSYFMISRSLGPAVGGAVGLLFYIANSLSCALYTIGAVEILIKYICPQSCRLFGDDVEIPSVALNHFRIYGIILLIVLCMMVFVGIRFISIFAPISLFCVLFSVLCIYIGLIKAVFAPPNVPICLMNSTHLLKSNALNNSVAKECSNTSPFLYNQICPNTSNLCPLYQSTCTVAGVPGLGNSQFLKNLHSQYRDAGDIAPDSPALDKNMEVFAQEVTTFFILIGIYFPSVTGIMAGSNRSGDLKDASKSIPRGTLAAIATTSAVYITYCFLVGSSIDGRLLRDKFGDSIDKKLIISMIAWPSKWVILIGSLLSTLGAGLQTLTGAPRIMQALANDGVIPMLTILGKTSSSGEPRRAVILTAFIALIGILIADLDKITPLLSMFFLLCYGFVNLACALQSLLKTPSWRPSFRYYHCSLSMLGVVLCVAIMFMASWLYALIAIIVAALAYKYIEYKGAEKEWGDGLTGLQLSAAHYALRRLEEDKETHSRNWRPELMVLVAMTEDGEQVVDNKVLSFTAQLKHGGGLVIVGNVLTCPNYLNENCRAMVAIRRKTLKDVNKSLHINAFRNVVVARTIYDGLALLIQNSGLGGMKPNTLIITWPDNWRSCSTDNSIRDLSGPTFIHTLKVAEKIPMALMVAKGLGGFPEMDKKLVKSSTIDLWWILHDAGLMLLTAHLLRKHKVWHNCTLRIFTIANSQDDAVIARNYITNMMTSIRIKYHHLDVIVVESSAISAYVYERTIEQIEGVEILKQLREQRRALSHAEIDQHQFTFTPAALSKALMSSSMNPHLRSKKIHSAHRLNEHLLRQSKNAELIIINLPPPPTSKSAEYSYMNYIDTLCSGITSPIFFVRGSGRELISSVS